jgi:protein-disulfide isomerase
MPRTPSRSPLRALLAGLTRSLSTVTALATLATIGCGGPEKPVDTPAFASAEPRTPASLPGPPAPLPVESGAPGELRGVDTAQLNPREKQLFWALVHELYAPCPSEAVSVAACVREGRSCAACAPAARMLASKARAGGAREDIVAAYAIRFGPTVASVPAGDSPTRGESDAPVTVVVWSDFECPACKATLPRLEEQLDKVSRDVRLVHKMYPLGRAALAAHLQGKYWAMEKTLFEHQDKLEEPDLLGYARSLGLDQKRFKADMAGQKVKGMLERDKADAKAAGLDGTPFVLINGRHFDFELFKLEEDLVDWVKTDVELAGQPLGAVAPTPPRVGD